MARLPVPSPTLYNPWRHLCAISAPYAPRPLHPGQAPSSRATSPHPPTTPYALSRHLHSGSAPLALSGVPVPAAQPDPDGRAILPALPHPRPHRCRRCLRHPHAVLGARAVRSRIARAALRWGVPSTAGGACQNPGGACQNPGGACPLDRLSLAPGSNSRVANPNVASKLTEVDLLVAQAMGHPSSESRQPAVCSDGQPLRRAEGRDLELKIMTCPLQWLPVLLATAASSPLPPPSPAPPSPVPTPLPPSPPAGG
eukprot:scaffold2014_cov52-Phaeocystis_antarctica.AAC.1